MKTFKFINCLALVISLVACSSSHVATTLFQDGFNFAVVESYSTYGRNSSFGDLQNLNDSLRNTIELAIEQGFDDNGFRYVMLESADIVIGYHLLNHNMAEFRKYNQQVKYCGYCLNAEKT